MRMFNSVQNSNSDNLSLINQLKALWENPMFSNDEKISKSGRVLAESIANMDLDTFTELSNYYNQRKEEIAQQEAAYDIPSTAHFSSN